MALRYPGPMSPTSDVVALAQDLIRIDTSNFGDDSGPGEVEATEYVASLLADVGLDPVIRESEPRRTNLIALWEGSDRSRPPIVVHGHLDVVPALEEGWTHPPFAGKVSDGMVWGRGAVDMKGTDAMILASVVQMIGDGIKPARDVVLAFFADEEAGGARGSRFMAENHPDDFRGAREAISEVGGFSAEIGGRRAYLIQTAEKGIQWLRLVAEGTAGHGSLVHRDNAVTHLAEAVSRIGHYEWPLDLTPTVEALLKGVAGIVGEEYSADPGDIGRLVSHLGHSASLVEPTLRNTSNPTQLKAGYKANVIPGTAEAVIDTRFLPGRQEEALRTIEDLAGPRVRVEPIVADVALEWDFGSPFVGKMVDALGAEDPGALVLPYTLFGGTDGKGLSRLGIASFGFAPLRLPAGFDFPGMFHAVDERIPVESLEFGVRVLKRFLMDC